MDIKAFHKEVFDLMNKDTKEIERIAKLSVQIIKGYNAWLVEQGTIATTDDADELLQGYKDATMITIHGPKRFNALKATQDPQGYKEEIDEDLIPF